MTSNWIHPQQSRMSRSCRCGWSPRVTQLTDDWLHRQFACQPMESIVLHMGDGSVINLPESRHSKQPTLLETVPPTPWC